MGLTVLVGLGLLMFEVFMSHTTLGRTQWTRQHTTPTRDRHPSPRRDSNPQF